MLAFIGTRQGGAALREDELFVAFWEYLETLAGSVLFFALGVATGAHDFPVSWAIPGVVLVLLVARAVVVYGGAALINQVHPRLPPSCQHVMMLGGLRGAVSAALVLMIPHDDAYCIDVLCLVFVLCLCTLKMHTPLLRLVLQRGSVHAPA